MADYNPTQIPDDVKSRFWAKVDVRGPDECWPWRGSTVQKDGRGTFGIGKKNVVAPRIALAEHLGRPIQPTLFACHSCDNPNCVNPAHLWEGTAKQNSEDARAKKRLNGMQFTHCPRGHPYDEENTFLHRGQRECRQCRNARARANNAGISIDEALITPKAVVTHCPAGHEYTPENTQIYLRKNGWTDRKCAICMRAHRRAWVARKRAADAMLAASKEPKP